MPDRRTRPTPSAQMIVAVSLIGIALLASSCGDTSGSSGGLVERYCQYGAVSQAQLDGCIGHVGASEVRQRNTNAAQYARGELDACLADAGPYCR